MRRITLFDLSDIVGIVFIILKLCKVIDWSWWWVTSPIWIGIIIWGIIYGLICLLENRNVFRFRRKRK